MKDNKNIRSNVETGRAPSPPGIRRHNARTGKDG